MDNKKKIDDILDFKNITQEDIDKANAYRKHNDYDLKDVINALKENKKEK